MDLGKRTRIDDLECSMFEPPSKRSCPSPFRLSQAVPKRFLKAYTHVPEKAMGTVSLFGRIFPALVALLTSELCFHKFKATLVLRVEMTKTTADGKSKVERPYFSSKPYTILSQHDIENVIAKAQSAIETNIDKWTREGSGWVVDRVETMYVNIAKYQPLTGSSYMELPKYLKKKEAIINVRNQDNECLKWALLSARHPVKKNAQRVNKYITHQDELNFTGIEFPTPLNQIPNVEHQNNLSINVFGYSESAGIHPLYLTKDHTRDPINLLLITKVEDGKILSHYCWIKDFNRLCFDQNKHRGKTFFCTRCISGHCSERTLQDHMIYCRGVDTPPCHAVFPQATEDGSPPTIQFKNIQHLMKAPYVIYADTESIVKPADSPNTDTNTVQTSEHIPCSFAYVIVRSDGRVMSEKLYRGEDAMDVLFNCLEQELENIREDLKNERPLAMTQQDWAIHSAADKCWVCDGPFKPYEQGDTEGVWKVRDHDHLTGKYRGPAHSKCNLSLRIDPFHTPVPILFHNLKNYDAHHLISAIGRTEVKETVCTDKNGQPLTYKDKKGVEKKQTVTDGKISAIVQNMEKLISFSWGQFRFIDSYAFLSSSLGQLVANTPKANLSITRSYIEQAKFNLITRKGSFHTNIWTLLIVLRRPSSRRRKTSIPASLTSRFQIRTINMHRKCGRLSIALRSGATTTYTWKRTFCFWPTCSKISGRPLSPHISWTLPTTTLYLATPGMPSSSSPMSLSNFSLNQTYTSLSRKDWEEASQWSVTAMLKPTIRRCRTTTLTNQPPSCNT